MEEIKEKNKKNWFLRHKVWSVILALLAVGLFQTIVNGSNTGSNNQPTSSPTPTVTKSPVKKRDIVLTSMIVKKVGVNTYRYFFNIANNDTKDFSGSITLNILNGHQTPMPLIFGGAQLDLSKTPVQAGANSVTYVDDNHAPSQVDGIDGATTFVYSAYDGDNQVASGKGDIGQYENDLMQQ